MWIIFKLKNQLVTDKFDTFTTTTNDKLVLKFHKEIMGKLVVIDSEGNMYIEEKEGKLLFKYTLLKYYIKQKEKK